MATKKKNSVPLSKVPADMVEIITLITVWHGGKENPPGTAIVVSKDDAAGMAYTGELMGRELYRYATEEDTEEYAGDDILPPGPPAPPAPSAPGSTGPGSEGFTE